MKGFTLIESIVTIAVIVIMAVIVLANYDTLRTQSALNRAVQKIVVDIRKAQNFSAQTRRLSDGSIPCGYGIHYEADDTYILFADIDNSGSLCGNADQMYDTNDDVDVEIIRIRQQSMEFSGSFQDILFFPPDPLTFINGGNPPGVHDSGLSTTINLCFEGNSPCRQVIVWGSGLIDIE